MTRIKIITAGLLAALTLGAASPAYADEADRCERKLERVEDRFRTIEARFGWEVASEWWNEIGWPRYYAKCGGVA